MGANLVSGVRIAIEAANPVQAAMHKRLSREVVNAEFSGNRRSGMLALLLCLHSLFAHCTEGCFRAGRIVPRLFLFHVWYASVEHGLNE